MSSDEESDFEQINNTKKIKIEKVDESYDKNYKRIEVCIICLEPWTLSGEHRLASVKCGHFFGKNCIEKWMTTNKICPTCKAPFTKNDLRNHFIDINCMELIDNTELVETQEKLENAKNCVKHQEIEISHLKMKSSILQLENDNLKEQLKVYEAKCNQFSYQISKMGSDIPKDKFRMELMKKFTISNTGNCRVMSYSQISNWIAVSCPSSNSLFTGYGVKMVDANHMRIMKFNYLHENIIRDLSFSRNCSSNLLISGSMDKTVKLSCTQTSSIVCTSKCSSPVWSVCWSNNNHMMYAGLASGEVCELDSRRPGFPLSTVWKQPGGPIHSLNYISSGNHFGHNSGLLISNATGTIFLPKESIETPISEGDVIQAEKDYIKSLLLASDLEGTISHTSFNAATGHILTTLRTSQRNGRLRSIVSEIGQDEECPDSLYCVNIKTFNGGHLMKYMTRSGFLSTHTSDLYAAIPDEESASLNIYDFNHVIPVAKFCDRGITINKPIIDICQIDHNPLIFGAINSDFLYLIKCA